MSSPDTPEPQNAPDSLSPEAIASIRDNLDEVAARAAAAAEASGRTSTDVQVLLATKTQPADKIRVALEHGFTLIGENKVQELVGKAEELADLDHEAHLIGPLQKNKVNHTLRHAHCIQSVDNLELVTKINNRLEVLDSTVDIFVQVNTSREDSKSGIAPEEAEGLITELRGLSRMKLRGLMTIGLPGRTPEEIRPSYSDLRELREKLIASGVMPAEATELSMGMSNDFELAIAEGATMVRVGSSVFGARDYS
ncbi:MAG: YggS family pyridoxal phosphate-dependent enzyme [Brevibacterium aurantiacum]|uniref:Pyridoxal phosphate homeostasis protein n=1 Tax=Brevibacterium aurantiacum TaxID=273384 RepID=A0A2H1IMX0_BREAU|nr:MULTISPECIES: YggS family pyridoxal phosphate-dependent enzyme [Brevibacterium]MDN5586530.1 YggS family pyridoxal phosphate-dependent enzyme [Brevibacterium sp.]MDN5736039.1 YggS family pyridoxal phosphate-dependent enzyme [Brevibacterium aurantiacum]MDN5738408.1 YggS family pyridoxal phosphate-dependent enzyme [Brevibacterium aurantiacum]MDN5774811.1 YggS family pyridoxal phosphate-dependent enzyme [Brevibacterium aurantiacum]PCC56487.1 YggS family pyridoxal phosphate-dependent enzyme [Bre